MVTLSEIELSNSQIATSFPPGLVAVFVGATRGIGEMTLKRFAKHARRPRTYIVGRSDKDGDRVVAECKQLSPEGEFIFIRADVGLIRTVDEVCAQIQEKEKAVNLLFLTTGTLASGIETSEGLHLAATLITYSRVRFIMNLLPLLQAAFDLRRVVSVFAGTKEGPVMVNDIQSRNVTSLLSLRGHAASLVTLGLQVLAEKAPTVTFIHNFPGAVKTDLAKDAKGIMWFFARNFFRVFGGFFCMPSVECGERHLFLATSSRFPARQRSSVASSTADLGIARGIDGKEGSGMYSIDRDGESAIANVEKLIATFKTDGTMDMVWKDEMTQFQRITKEEAE